MNVILEISGLDTVVLGLVNDDAASEAIVVDRFKEIGESGEDLIRIEHGEHVLYTTRSPLSDVAEEDGFEYVDNEGNPINADGSEIIESDQIVDDIPKYQYDGEHIWVLSKTDVGQVLNLETSQFLDLLYGIPTNPFEEDENLVVVTTI